MGLSKTQFDVDLLTVKLMQLGEKSSREILAVMRDEAEKLRDTAREFAPIDDGELEQAIKVVEDREGINRRTQVSVIVDETMTDHKGRPIGEYAMLMHEMLAPYGSGQFHLGEKSLAKDGGSGRVGGKYLERAVRSRIGMIGKRIKEVAERVFK